MQVMKSCVMKAVVLVGTCQQAFTKHDAHSSILDSVPCRWRTCLIVRELELEIDALAQGQVHRNKLKVRMHWHLLRRHLLFC